MSRFRCPRCPETLGFAKRGPLRWWQCPDGHGRALNFTVVRKRAGAERFRSFWTAVRAATEPGDVRCPSCGRPMKVVRQTVGGAVVEVDVCTGCQLAWFDDGEDRQIAGALPAEAPDPLAHLAPEDRLEVQQAQARLAMESSTVAGDYADTPASVSGAGHLGAYLGIPVEDGEPPRTVPAFVTRSLVLVMVAGSLFALSNADTTYETYGLLAEAPLRGGGLAAAVGALTDPNLLTASLNAVVLWRLGDNIEDLLGHLGYGLLLVVATVAAWGVHAVALSRPEAPMYGLTSGAAAVAVLYALRFPQVRLGWYYHDDGGWFRDSESGWWMVPVRWAVLGWLALALAAPWMMSEPDPPNSWAEALVGAVVGAVAWATVGQGVLRHPDELP